MLQLKKAYTSTDKRGLTLPSSLIIAPELGCYGLPVLVIELPSPVSRALRLALHIHNSAGIPIIEAQAHIAPDECSASFDDMRPQGIEAYAHKSVAEQAQIAQRIWSRRAYATIQLVEEPVQP